MRWQARRGLLNPLDASPPGSVVVAGDERAPAARRMRSGRARGRPRRRVRRREAVRLWLEFIATPTTRHTGTALTTRASWPATWSTNGSPTQRRLPERFFMNVALVRVLYAHALVAAPRLALGRFAPLSRAARRSPARDGGRVPLAPPRASRTTIRSPRDVECVHRRRAASRPVARLRGDRPAAATPVRVVRRGARRTTPARAGSRRQPDLRVALRAATRLARSAHAAARADHSNASRGPADAASPPRAGRRPSRR